MPPRPHAVAVASAAAVTVALAASAGCQDSVPSPVEDVASLPTPANEGSGMPNLLATEEGAVYLSWLQEREEGGHALRFDRLALDPGGGNKGEPSWNGPRTIVRGEDFFVNWADFPSMSRFPDGRLASHWLVRSGPGPVDYDIHLAWSGDGGESWSDPVIPHRDGEETEHGFVSLFPWEDGSLGVAWLDGREIAREREDAAMTLRFTTFGSDGSLGDEELLDGHVCDCCPTSAAVTDEGPVVVYRDRTRDEIRDISIIRHRDGEWTEPEAVHRDGWEIAACPVNGPMASAQGRRLAVAWYTGAQDDPRVLVAFSDDGGASFADPIRVDGGDPLGRAAVDLLPSGDAVVAWLETEEDGDADVRVRRVTTTGAVSEPETVGRSAASRAAGFPRMVRHGDRLVFAWTDARAEEPRVRVAWGRTPSP